MSRGQRCMNSTIEQKMIDQKMRKHNRKISAVRSSVDSSNPKSSRLVHMKRNLKRRALLEERASIIERDNRHLYNHITSLLKSPATVDHVNHGHKKYYKSLNKERKNRSAAQINAENRAIVNRLHNAKFNDSSVPKPHRELPPSKMTDLNMAWGMRLGNLLKNPTTGMLSEAMMKPRSLGMAKPMQRVSVAKFGPGFKNQDRAAGLRNGRPSSGRSASSLGRAGSALMQDSGQYEQERQYEQQRYEQEEEEMIRQQQMQRQGGGQGMQVNRRPPPEKTFDGDETDDGTDWGTDTDNTDDSDANWDSEDEE